MKVKSIFEGQRHYFETKETLSVDFRISQLTKLKNALKSNEERIFRAIYKDFNKSAYDTYITELGQVYKEISLFIKKLKKWSKPKKVRTNIINFPGSSKIIPEPLGCTLVFGAWNYPIYLSLMPVIASLGAGNTVILKPSEIANKTSNVLATIINNEFNSNYLCVIEGGKEVATEILKLKFDKIFFTGSTKVGKIVYQAAANHLTPVTLELGGKSPTFVLEDSNLKMAAKRIAWSKFVNAGQTCVAPDYLVVHKNIEDKFLELLKYEIEKNYTSNGELSENYAQIINEPNFDRLENLIDPQKVFIGGKSSKDTRYISPTILREISFDDKIMEEEIFGPLLPIISYTNLEKVVDQIRRRPKPLACYIYSNNQEDISYILSQISFGGGAINDSVMHLSNSNLPFGGVGSSGFGSYHGKNGFDAFSHHKSILARNTWFESSVKYYPYTKAKWKLLRWLFE